MKFKFKWFITFCFFLLVGFTSFSVCVNAAPLTDMDSVLFSNFYPSSSLSGDKNLLIITSFTPFDHNGTTCYQYTSSLYSSPTTITLTKQSNSSVLISSSSPISKFLCNWYPRYSWETNTSNDLYAGYFFQKLVDSADAYTSNFVSLSGNVTKVGSVIYSDGSSISVSSADSVFNPPKTSPDDVLNYNWSGDGIKIYNLSEGMNVSGYLDQSLKYFDIETYGKFTYKGSDTFFTSIAYKKMQTSIQLASIVTYGDETRRAGEGLGIKDFKWVSDTSHLKTGDEIRFRIVYQIPMLDKGKYDIKIGTTYNNGLNDLYMSDSVESINFLNENWDYGSPMDDSGETGNVGNEPGNTPKDPSNGGSIGSDPYSNMQYVLTLLSSFSGFIGSLFGFLPSEVKIMFVGVCTIIVALMVKRAVL